MTYVVSQNQIAAPLNQQSTQTFFITNNIQDPIVQQNFDQLNRFLAARIASKTRAPANYVTGPGFAMTTPTDFASGVANTPIGQLQCQIKTSGNPIRVRISPYTYSPLVLSYSTTGFQVGSYITLIGTNVNAAVASVGWMRTAAGAVNGNGTIISSQQISVGCTPNISVVGVNQSVSMSIPLPAFELEDSAPAGTYTYTFCYQMLNPLTMKLQIFNVNVTAYELGG